MKWNESEVVAVENVEILTIRRNAFCSQVVALNFLRETRGNRRSHVSQCRPVEVRSKTKLEKHQFRP